MGLLMERLYFTRVVHAVRKSLGKFQTGYIYRCEYQALVFHEIAAARVELGVGMVTLMGDLVGAFPKSWRELLIVLAALAAHVVGSQLVLLKEFLRNTSLEVTCGGESIVDIHSGIPEGGMLGPLLYPLLPNMLDKMLHAAGAGIGIGTPAASLAELVRHDALDPASAAVFAKADAASQQRGHILLVADDQIFPESCLLRLQAHADIVSEWADAVRQEYHVASPDKTTVLQVGAAARPDVYNQSPVMLSRSPVPCALKKKWVGVLWDHLLTFQPFQLERMGAARGAFKPLAGLAAEGVVPLAEIRELMSATVEGTLFFGAMFTYMAQDACLKLDALQLEFERKLLGAPPWFWVAGASRCRLAVDLG